jgi:hypothetical protein
MLISKLVFLVYLWTIVIPSVDAWKVPLQQRQLQLSQEQQNMLDQCEAAIDAMINRNPNIDTTEDALETAMEKAEDDLGTCSQDSIVSSLTTNVATLTGDPVEYSCILDYAQVNDGVPFNNHADACTGAGGTIFVFTYLVQCNSTLSISNLTNPLILNYGRTNEPECGLTQDVESSCDYDLYRQYIESEIPLIIAEIESEGAQVSGGRLRDIQCSVASFELTQSNRTGSGGNGNGTGTGGGSGNTNVTSSAFLHSRSIARAVSPAITGLIGWWLFNGEF